MTCSPSCVPELRPGPQRSCDWRNASKTKPAKLLAVFVVDTNETELTTDSGPEFYFLDKQATSPWREPIVTLQ
jgi:hypothetical protein